MAYHTPLTPKQRKFLQYLNIEHNGIGYKLTIYTMLRDGRYAKHIMAVILADWKGMIHGTRSDDCEKFGTPKKYTNIKNIEK